MRLTTLRITSTRTAAARVDRTRLTLLPFPDVGTLVTTGEAWQDRAAAPGEVLTRTTPRRTPGRSPPGSSPSPRCT
ncbi:hypothetical protein [Streptomyces sp. NPDC001933]|uniref:hypothetical protein n=1 Tax=Streptomyces sp. NPDC001933 TaxID=3364626 RepID=UPI00368132F5